VHRNGRRRDGRAAIPRARLASSRSRKQMKRDEAYMRPKIAAVFIIVRKPPGSIRSDPMHSQSNGSDRSDALDRCTPMHPMMRSDRSPHPIDQSFPWDESRHLRFRDREHTTCVCDGGIYHGARGPSRHSFIFSEADFSSVGISHYGWFWKTQLIVCLN
jgi:hypothetical protein